MTVTENSNVKVHYTGRLKNNEVFDSSVDREPLGAKLGEGKLIPGFEQALYGMTKGDKKTITILAEEAYGPVSQDRIQEVEREYVPENVTEGQSLTAQTPEGPVNVIVKEVKEKTVVLDGNHPLAGQDLIFDLEVVEVA